MFNRHDLNRINSSRVAGTKAWACKQQLSANDPLQAYHKQGLTAAFAGIQDGALASYSEGPGTLIPRDRSHSCQLCASPCRSCQGFAFRTDSRKTSWLHWPSRIMKTHEDKSCLGGLPFWRILRFPLVQTDLMLDLQGYAGPNSPAGGCKSRWPVALKRNFVGNIQDILELLR